MNRPIDNDARALRDAVRQLIVAHDALNETQRPCGAPLSTAHAWSLLELKDDGAMTCTNLAERLHIDRTNVSRLCARMESLGQIERVPHPTDGRARLIRLTREGERLAESVDVSSTKHFGLVLAKLDNDTAEIIEAVERLTHALADTSMTKN